MSHTPARTVYAQRAMSLTDYLTEHFRMTVVGGVSGPRFVRFVAPQVESTDGGKAARQSVHLVRKDGSEPPIVCGFIDIGAGDAQMRGIDALKSIHRERHGVELKISKEDYEQFLEDLRESLAEHEIKMLITNEVTQTKAVPPPPAPVAAPAMNQDVRAFAMLGAGILVGLIIGALIWSPASPF